MKMNFHNLFQTCSLLVLLDKIRHEISLRTAQSQAMSPETNLFIALRFEATVSYQNLVGDTSRVSQQSVSKVVVNVFKIDSRLLLD